MKIIDLYNEIYVFSFRKKKKIYYTRNKVKKLRKIITNKRMFETLMENNAVKVYGQVPEKIKNALINEFGFHVSYSVTKNMTILLALLV